jgi:hypothetical protein
MTRILLYGLFLGIFLLLLVKRKDFIYYLLPLNIILDTTFNVFQTLSFVTYFRGFLLLVMILLYAREFARIRKFRSLYIFFAYTLILVFLSDETFFSIKYYSQVFLTMMMFPVGFVAVKDMSQFNRLNKSLVAVLILSTLASLLGYFFNIGYEFEYGEEEGAIGLLLSGGLYPAALAIASIPVLMQTYDKRNLIKFLIYIVAITCYIFILLNIRRTAILIPVVGLFFFLLFTPQKGNFLIFLTAGLGVLLLLSPLYEDMFLRRFEIRQEEGRFEKNFYENESRYITTLEIYNEISSMKDPVKSFFGRNIYTSGYEEGERPDRILHADHNVLLDGTGIIGFILYLFIYVRLIRFIRFRRRLPDKRIRMLNSYGVALIAISLFVSLNGSLFLVSFRSTIFLYLGVTLGLLYRYSRMYYYGVAVPRESRLCELNPSFGTVS